MLMQPCAYCSVPAGIQMMFPLALLGCCVLVPINAQSAYISRSVTASNGNSINPSSFMKLTMTNISDPDLMCELTE